MDRLLTVTVLLSMLWLQRAIAGEGMECPSPDAGAVNPGGQYMTQEPGSWKPQRLPLRGGVAAALDKLDSNDELPLVHTIDLNHDGRKELFLAPPAGRLCGTGGCPYVLLRPGSLAIIGEFFGHLAFLDERSNGFRIIQTYSHRGAGLTSLNTYRYDRGKYQLGAHVMLDSCGFEQWQRQMRN